MSRSRIVLGAVLLTLVASVFADDQRTQASEKNLFLISYESKMQPVSINRIHSWVVHVETADGVIVDNASISLVGGMPDHDHGLPTLPQSTRYLGDGDYLVEGVKFHMNGRWEVTMTITVEGRSDTVKFDLQL